MNLCQDCRSVSGKTAILILLVVPSFLMLAKQESLSSQRQKYSNDKFQLTFAYPKDWILEERIFRESTYSQAIKHQVYLRGTKGEFVYLSIFDKRSDLREWIKESKKSESKISSINPDEWECGSLSSEVYASLTYKEDRVAGFAVVLQGGKYLYEVVFSVSAYSDVDQIEQFVRSLSSRSDSLITLPFDLHKINFAGESPLVQDCAPCGESDIYLNSYECCTGSGNCTWYVEKATSGNNNFIFGGVGTGRNANTWMSKAFVYNTGINSFGGTIPIPGCAVVFVNNGPFSQGGHVAYVTGVQGDGSILVTEQSCGLSCTVSNTYHPSTLRDYLAGYIYPTATPPSPSRKDVTGVVSGDETIVDDWNKSSVYNFSTNGPGHINSFNSNERAWGTLATGAYNDWMHFTATLTGTSINSGIWAFNILNSGYYEIRAFIPNNSYVTATRARYRVTHNNNQVAYSAPVDQSNSKGQWVQIYNANHPNGYWNFVSGSSSQSVKLEDNYGTNNSESGLWLAFDAIKFIYRVSVSTITVTAPVAGAAWAVGATQTVTWTSSGVTGNVSIKLSTDGGSTFPITLTSNTTNDGTEAVAVPNNPSTTCRVKVESVLDQTVFGTNPGTFTIGTQNGPIVVTTPASAITDHSAQLNGTLNSNGSDSWYWFEWGKSTGYGSSSFETGRQYWTSPQPVQYTIMGLDPSTTYHFRLGGRNSNGTNYGDDQTFVTEVQVPIQLSSFAGYVTGYSDVVLTWTTISETNNYGFYIHRRADNQQDFSELTNSFIPGHGTTLAPQNYSFTDNTARSGTWYYRLKQVDLDGTIHFSDPIRVDLATDVKEIAPMVFSLHQNYPNPFNPESIIKFSVDATAPTALVVYNSLGQEVARLFDDVAEPGQYYCVKLNRQDLASGVYLYRLRSGKRNDVKKLVLLK